jgi:hypothetical protein
MSTSDGNGNGNGNQESYFEDAGICVLMAVTINVSKAIVLLDEGVTSEPSQGLCRGGQIKVQNGLVIDKA